MVRRLLVLAILAIALRADAHAILWNRHYRSPADGELRAYDVWTPSAYDPIHPLPAILFLHGRGASRTSFQQPSFLEAADAAGVIEIFWQGRFQPEIGAFSTLYVDGKNGVPDETDVLACLDDALGAFAIDPERVHLAGFSQGGKGALLIGLKNPDRFASVAEGAGPSDAFQGQLWSPTFPDFAAAAGGPATGATGERLALWYAQSARFFLPNARNLPLALFHGAADNVVPDSPFLFPYRNTHHIADTPGFSDARGRTPTLSELHASDPEGYAFTATYPAGVGHEWAAFPAASLFSFIAGKSRVQRPPRVVARTYEAGSKSFYWLRLSRVAPPDGSPVGVTGTLSPGGVSLSTSGAPAVTLDASLAGLDPTAGVSVTQGPGSTGTLRLHGAFPGDLRVIRDGLVLAAGAGYERDGPDVLLPFPGGQTTSTVTIAPAPTEAVAADDLLVPALVDAAGLLDARFRSELVIANLAPEPARLEALLADVTSSYVPALVFDVPASTTLLLRSQDLLPRFGLARVASPLRLRVLAGGPSKVFASVRVFNDTPGGTYGLSFPVGSAAASSLGGGDVADVFGGRPGHPSRTNLSLFAPLGAALAEVTVAGADGTPVRTIPVTLASRERVQLDDLLAAALAPARATVRILSGRVQAYATVIENAATNDPFRSPPLLRARNATRWVVPAVASAPGRAGAYFTSDLYLAAPAAEAPVSVTITFLPRGTGASLSASTTLPPGAVRVVADVLGSLFPAQVPGSGALRVDADAAIAALVVNRNDSQGGPDSQDLAALREDQAITPTLPALFTGLAESAAARSNLVLVNLGESTTVTLSLFTESGSRGTFEVPLASGEVRQLDSVLAAFGSDASGAAALLVAPLSGAVFASAVRIDNLSNDPSGLAPHPAPALAR